METPTILENNNSTISSKTVFFCKTLLSKFVKEFTSENSVIEMVQYESDSQSNINSLINAFVSDDWDEEGSKGTDAICKRIALKLAEFLDKNNIPEGFAYPKYNGGIGFMWGPGRTKKLEFEAEIEFSEKNEDEVVFFIYASVDNVEIFNEYISDFEEFVKKIIHFFREYKEI